MFERFTERARLVVDATQREASAFRHGYVGTEHLLLGLLTPRSDDMANRVLASFGVTLENVRSDVERIVGKGEEPVSGRIPFTPRVKKALELALREALSLGHNYIGSEHILLGLVRENEGVGARILEDRNVVSEEVRNRIIREMQHEPRCAECRHARSEHSREDDLCSHDGCACPGFALPPTTASHAHYTVDIQVRCRRWATASKAQNAAPELSAVASAANAAARRVIEDAGFEITGVGFGAKRVD